MKQNQRISRIKKKQNQNQKKQNQAEEAESRIINECRMKQTVNSYLHGSPHCRWLHLTYTAGLKTVIVRMPGRLTEKGVAYLLCDQAKA